MNVVDRNNVTCLRGDIKTPSGQDRYRYQEPTGMISTCTRNLDALLAYGRPVRSKSYIRDFAVIIYGGQIWKARCVLIKKTDKNYSLKSREEENGSGKTFGFMDVILLPSGHQHVWARTVRTRTLI